MVKKSRKTRVEAASAKPAAAEKPAAGPTLRWFVCEDGGVHVFGPCPRCFQSGGGMMLGSTLPESRGIARARCTECGETMDYFIDPRQQQVWKAEAIREPVGATQR
jgi:hypothetical protein